MTTPSTTIAIPLFPRLHRARRHRAVRGAPAHPRASTSRSSGTSAASVRSENGFLGITIDDHVRGGAVARRRRVPRRRRHAAPDERRAGARLGAHGARDDDVHDVGVHRLAACSPRAGLLDGLTATTHWVARDVLAEARRHRQRGPGGRAPRSADHHGGRCLERHRHGAAAGRAAGRPHGGRSGPADDRVRPAAAVRRPAHFRRPATTCSTRAGEYSAARR